jgi:hypothetical protein
MFRMWGTGPDNMEGKEILALTTGKVKRYWSLQQGR